MNSEDMKRGIIPGVIAGYIFLAYVGAGTVPVMEEGVVTGTAMSLGMIDSVGAMIGADAFVGFILHVVISLVVGALYTGVFLPYVNLGNSLTNIVVGGLIYGIIWWIIGGNIIAPVVAGGDILQLSIGPSFYGHIIFGHALAFLVAMGGGASSE